MRRLLSACLLALLAFPSAAAADPRKSRHLWATVNICDTERNPDTLGIRASMPGSGRRRESMWMRFRVQYFSEREQMWHNFTVEGADSGPVKVARHAAYKARQSGYVFPFSPEVGDRYLLRGSVEFQWRDRRGRVVRRVRELTTAGHHVSVADPEGYSEATCEILG
ncbi:MAG TPA: hypothetical protein VHF89_12825 [Solirubrobacteraceae bacterium]|nr:hypothetical protein [Solirubrobacteraceae bacterium]